MKQINQRIRLTILIFLVIISLFIFLGIYKPLSTQLERVTVENYRQLTHNKHQVLETFLMSVRYNAASLSSRTVIRDMLADYLESKVTFEELKQFTIPRYNDGVAVFDQLRSAARVAQEGLVIHSIGPDENIADLIAWDETELTIKYISDERLVIVQSPVKKGDKLLAWDVIITDANLVISDIEAGIYRMDILADKRADEVTRANGEIISYIGCDAFDGTMVISADESNIFGTVQKLMANINIRYFLVLFAMFVIIQFFIVRYIRGFIQTQQELKAAVESSEQLMRMTLEVTGEGIWDWRIEEGTVYHNRRWCSILGLDESYMTGRLEEFTIHLHPDDREKVIALINEAVEAQGEYFSEHRMVRKDGGVIWVEDRGAVVKRKEGKAQRMIGSISDITQRKQAQLDLFLEKELFQSTLLSVGDGIISTDVNGQIRVLNKAAEALTGWNQNEAIGRNVGEVLKMADNQTGAPIDWLNEDAYEKQMQRDADRRVQFISRNGRKRTIFNTESPVRLLGGEITGYVVVFRDVTELFEKQQKIEYLSFHDELTGLYNRRYMEDSLHRLNTARNLPYTIVMLDLNNLKLMNDIFGHEMGDQLLKNAANFLRGIFRADDIICRIGGDEFCILMPKTSAEAAEEIKQRIMHESSLWQVGPLRLSIAVGYAVKTEVMQKIEDIFHDSDLKMYQNKQECRQQVKNRTIGDFLQNNYSKLDEEKEHDTQVSLLASALYEHLGKTQAEVGAFRKAVEVHDIGKITIPGEVINKTEELTAEDWEKIKRHSQAGYQIIKVLKEHETYADAILFHHERVGGKGYPEGLVGDAIPLESRVIAIADAYEAMTAGRIYKKAMSREEAITELRNNAGTQFDASLVEIFIDKVLPGIAEG